MDRPEAFAQLPRAHALALQLRELGANDELIAACLEIDTETIGPLLEIAEAKLAHVEEIDLRDAPTETRNTAEEKIVK